MAPRVGICRARAHILYTHILRAVQNRYIIITQRSCGEATAVYVVLQRRRLCKLLLGDPSRSGGDKIARRRDGEVLPLLLLLLHEPSEVSNAIRRINTPPPPVVSRINRRAGGINPDKPTRINPQTKRKRVIYKMYRYARCTCGVCACARARGAIGRVNFIVALHDV